MSACESDRPTFRNPHSAFRISSRGQAIVEFMVALVVVIVIAAGLIQIGQLALAHTRTMSAARAAAGLMSISDTPPVSEMALLISDWVPGPDERQHTDDDFVVISSNAVTLPGELIAQAHLEWAPGLPTNALATLAAATNPAADFSLVKGEAYEEVPILPIISHLVYERPTLEVESEVWLVWREGIY